MGSNSSYILSKVYSEWDYELQKYGPVCRCHTADPWVIYISYTMHSLSPIFPRVLMDYIWQQVVINTSIKTAVCRSLSLRLKFSPL